MQRTCENRSAMSTPVNRFWSHQECVTQRLLQGSTTNSRTRAHAHTHAHTKTQACRRTYLCKRRPTRTHAYTNARTHARKQAYSNARLHARKHTQMHVRTHARACTVQIVSGDKTRVNVPPSQPSYVLVAIVVKVFSRVEGGIAETFSLYYVLA